MPLDEHKKTKYAKYAMGGEKHNMWTEKGGSWAFMVEYKPNKWHRKYEVWTQCHRGYKDNFSIRSFDRLGDALYFWGLLDAGLQFRELPKKLDRKPGYYYTQIAKTLEDIPEYIDDDGEEWPITKSGDWNGFFPNGDYGHHDDYPGKKYLPTPYEGEADTYC